MVSAQVQPEALGAFAAERIVVVVNHRPDHEEPGQPTSAEMAAAAESAGLRYHHLPVSGMPGGDVGRATAEVLAQLLPGEQALMFCRSGMRSTAAWALARRAEGVDADTLRAAAAAAGYDLSRLPL